MRRPEPWMRLAETLIIPPIAVWFRWRFEGMEHVPPTGPVLVACNHISYFDPLAHGYFVEKAGRRPRFLAKIELYKNPVLGYFLRHMDQIPVVRGSGDRRPFDAAVAALERGEAVMVYPESTVTSNPDSTPMRGKTGVARMALSTGLPVLPLAVWGTQHVWQREGAKSLRFGRPIWVRAGAPLDVTRDEGEEEDPEVLRKVTDEVMAELTVLVDDLRTRYPKDWS